MSCLVLSYLLSFVVWPFGAESSELVLAVHNVLRTIWSAVTRKIRKDNRGLCGRALPATPAATNFRDENCRGSHVGCFCLCIRCRRHACHYRDYFGASEATIFSKRGSPRKISQRGL